jgi:hypothetical protein
MMAWARFGRDRRGASIVTYALILPLFILLVFGILEIWRVVSVRQSLHLGTYQAIRALSSTGRHWLPTSAGQWQSVAAGQAQVIINQELKRNSLLPPNHELQVQVTIDADAPANLSELGWLFTVRAQLTVDGLVTLPLLDVGALTLNERQVSYIEGITGDWSPPVEGKPY